MSETNKKVLIVVAILAVVGVAGYFLLNNQSVRETLEPSGERSGEEQGEEPSEQMKQTQGEEASKKTQKLIEDITRKAQEADDGEDEGEEGDRRSDNIVEITRGEDEDGTSSTSTISGVRVAEGSAIINTETGEVVNDSGEKTRNDAEVGESDAPRQSSWLEDEEDLPDSVIRMNITEDSIDPAEFTVSPNQAVAIAVKAAGGATEIFRFDDPSLKGVAVGVSTGKTRVITFNAPSEPGEYTYYSDIANHRARGAEGVMIVE